MKHIGKMLFAVVLGFVLVGLAGCKNPRKQFKQFRDSDKYKIVATTTMLTDLAEQLGKDKVIVHSLMEPGVDPHTYNATSLDVEYLEAADMVLISGLHLEAQMGKAIKALKEKGKVVVSVGDHLEALHNDETSGVKLRDWTDPDDIEHAKQQGINHLFDPHFWFNVTFWKHITGFVADELAKNNATNKDLYESSKDAYLKELEEADTYIKGRVAELEESERILFTAHDAFSYFGEYYGFRVEAVQGVSTETQANTEDIENLAKQAKELGVRVIFIESSVPKKTIQAVQASAKKLGWELKISTNELYSDSLGDEKDGVTTYIKMIKANIDNIVGEIIKARQK